MRAQQMPSGVYRRCEFLQCKRGKYRRMASKRLNPDIRHLYPNEFYNACKKHWDRINNHGDPSIVKHPWSHDPFKRR